MSTEMTTIPAEARLSVDSLRATLDVHARLAELARSRPDRVKAALLDANRHLIGRGAEIGPGRPIRSCLSSTILTPADDRQLAGLAEVVHDAVELILERAVADDAFRDRWFPEQQRLVPYFARTRGIDAWQVFGRYDLAVAPDGRLRLLELNSSRPGGLNVSDFAQEATRAAYATLGVDDEIAAEVHGTVNTPRYVQTLLEAEVGSGIAPGLFGILFDENENTYELELMRQSVESLGREAAILDTRSLHFDGQTLRTADGRRLSHCHNRFRIATPDSPFDHWAPGFESRYHAYLAAQQTDTVFSANNMVSHAMAGNKQLLEVLGSEFVLGQLDRASRKLLESCLLWSTRLVEGARTERHGDEIDVMAFVRSHRDELVIKPACQSRGSGVVIGRYSTDTEWAEACTIDPRVPKIVQDFVEDWLVPVPWLQDGEVSVDPMHVVLGLAVVTGQYHGCISRVSLEPITNVARSGFPQAVFLKGC